MQKPRSIRYAALALALGILAWVFFQKRSVQENGLVAERGADQKAIQTEKSFSLRSASAGDTGSTGFFMSAKSNSSVTDSDNLWIEFTKRFSFPTEIDRASRIEEVFRLLQSPARQSRDWVATVTVPVREQSIKATFVTTFYDSRNHRASDPLRNISKPEELGWRLVGYFEREGRLYQANISTLIENVAKDSRDYFLYLELSDHEELRDIFVYWALPLPGDLGAAAQYLPAAGSKGWQLIHNFRWEPITETEYRKLVEAMDHDVN